VGGVTQALAEPNEGLPSGPVAEIPTLIINKPYQVAPQGTVVGAVAG